MTAYKFSPLLLLLFLFLGCSNDDAEVVIENLSYEVFFENHLSYSEQEKIPKQYQVFKNQKDWLKFIPTIEKVNPDRAKYLKKIEFDFGNDNLVIVIGENFSYCCSQITINQFYRRNNKIIADFEESGPGLAAAFSQAYLLLKTPK